MNIICNFFRGIDQIFNVRVTPNSKKTKKIYVVQKIKLIVNWPD